MNDHTRTELLREVGQLYEVAAELNRRIGQLEEAITRGTPLPYKGEPLDLLNLVETLVLGKVA
ncbi:MAG: hypothetical protein ACK443_05785 [Methylococcaceae bacterium]|jgi:hypothetical protein